MEISAERRGGGITVVRPEGRLDLLSAAELKRLLVEEVGAGQNHLVVDLAGVGFIDSSGLGALIGGLKAARTAGGNLHLARAGEQALTILELTTLDRVLRPYPTVEDALAAS